MIAILDSMSSGTDTGFDRFFQREFPAMVALAYSVSGSSAAAEDIAQDALSRAYRMWPKVSAYDKPGAWLRRVTINLALSTRRRLAAETKAKWRLGHPTLSETPAVHDDVWDAVRRLPGNQRAAVALHYLEDRSVAEVAEILDCAEATARVHLHRGRQALAAMLEGGEQ